MNVMMKHVETCQKSTKIRIGKLIPLKIRIRKVIQKIMAQLPQSESAEVQIVVQKTSVLKETGGMEIIVWSKLPFDSDMLCYEIPGLYAN